MSFYSNFFSSIGNMDGNQWAFVIGTNVVTGVTTHYATKAYYDVDEETTKERKARKEKRTTLEEIQKLERKNVNKSVYNKYKGLSAKELKEVLKDLKEKSKKKK